MMRVLLVLFLLAGLAALVPVILRMRPEQAAHLVRFGVAALVGLVGLVLTLAGRAYLGMPVLTGAVILFRRAWTKRASARRPGQKSRVYSDALMMELDLDTGDMNGMVLKGDYNGAELSELDDAALMKLHAELESWPESRDLLETYLDRRIADWRDGMDTQRDAGLGTSPGAGPMTEQEAYEILGLVAGAGEAEIRQAHRRLMKRVHPDTGGSAALASRLNAAKDLLLRRHV